MGYHSYSPQIRDALAIANEKGMEYTFLCENLKGAHPNTARIRYFLEDGTDGVVQGASIGGGNIVIDHINGMHVHFTGDYTTLLVMHEDKPGVIASVTNMMHWQYGDLNIANFRLSRQRKGGDAIMTIEMDNIPPDTLIDDIRRLNYVTNAILIRRL